MDLQENFLIQINKVIMDIIFINQEQCPNMGEYAIHFIIDSKIQMGFNLYPISKCSVKGLEDIMYFDDIQNNKMIPFNGENYRYLSGTTVYRGCWEHKVFLVEQELFGDDLEDISFIHKNIIIPFIKDKIQSFNEVILVD